jgi:NADH-quinone oxidoreductase subunit J
MTFEIMLFALVAALAIASAILMITRTNPVKSVLFLIVNFFCLAVLYLTLQAQFIAIIQILVYAGAIMVLFLFVIMLLNVKDEEKRAEGKSYSKLIALILSAIVLLQIIVTLGVSFQTSSPGMNLRAAEIGTVEFIGKSLYTEYLLPFEVTSMLLLAAMVGVIVLAKKKFQ